MAEPSAWLDELTGRRSPGRTLDLLERVAAHVLDPADLLRYHDRLLFEAAYPASPASWRFARRQLDDFATRVAGLADEERDGLLDSGILGTPQVYPYALPNAEWFASCPGTRVELAWDYLTGGSRRRLERLVGLLEPQAAPVGCPGWGVRRVLTALAGYGTAFDWLAERLRAGFPDAVGNYLYDACDLIVRIESTGAGPSRTATADEVRGRPALRARRRKRERFDFLKGVRRPLALGRPATRARGEALLGVVRGVILSRTRELHAMTHGNPDEVYETPVGRGASLAVWLLRPEDRLALEVGWYFMLSRNGIPIAYGGGGVFATRAEVGMNLLAEFREGREAAWILAQVCRAALSLCPAPWIVIRRYQFGGDGNEEGIDTGAYWFYDKLGFRSVDPRLRTLADVERRAIAQDPAHRTARRQLRRLAAADMILGLEGQSPSTYREYPLGAVGLRVCSAIAARFGGDRAGLDPWLAAAAGVPDVGSLDPCARRRAESSLFRLVTDAEFQPLARRLARLKGARREAGYARLLPAAAPWFDQLARATP